MLSAPLRRAVIALIAATGIAALSGCAATSPAIITRPYVAADGTDADLSLDDGSSIALRNFVVVLDKSGGTGQVIGAVAYSGTGKQALAIEAKDPAQVPPATPDPAKAAKADPADPAGAVPAAPSVIFEVTGGQLTRVGPGGVSFVLPVVKVAPGQYVDLTASSPAAGSVTWKVPVVPATRQYAGLTATTAATPTAKGTSSTDTETAETTEPETTP